jgi:hypothetical protein
MNDTPEQAPSRRRGRPPKLAINIPATASGPAITIPDLDHLAPPQDPVSVQVSTLLPDPPSQPGPSDEIDLREKPELRSILPGSDSQVRGASEVLPPLEAGTVPIPSPALPGPVQLNAPPVSIGPAVATGTESTVGGTSYSPVLGGDVVQVNNPQNKLYGTLFTVGDVQNHKVHGYQLSAGGKHEYFTVDEQECFRIGPSKVRSRNGCSVKWNAENR